MLLSPASRDTEEVRTSIRTLTSLLHRFNVQKSPSKSPKDIPRLLRHFTTLLTCGERGDEQAKKVIAVTGAIDATNQVKTLVVAQNRLLAPSVNHYVKLIEKDQRSLDEVVKGATSVPLALHIADVWVALSAFSPFAHDSDSQVESLQLFFLSRSYRKFLARFKEGKKLCGGRWLHEVIDDWTSNHPEIPCEWVVVPNWLLGLPDIPSIKSRKVGAQVQWEFSDDTKQAWAKVLQILMEDLHDWTEAVKSANTERSPEKKADAMRNLNQLCAALDYFISWEKGIVQSLLTKTNIVAGITTTFMPEDRSNCKYDEIDELVQEPGETQGQQVYRYLRTIVAWHTAVRSLTEDAAIAQVLRNLQIGLVEVPPSSSTVLTLPQVSEALLARFPDMRKFGEDDLLTTLTTRYSNKFTGCVHAEAALMGLVNYYGAQLTRTGQGAETEIENAQQLRDLIQPVAEAGNAVIAVSKKCCWCCDWLGGHLDAQFQLPGTHGLMFPWDPPVVGVDVSVLKTLEAKLWEELHRVVSSELQELLYSRHSSASSSFEGTTTEMMRFVTRAYVRPKRQRQA
ncbi:hypothetical protein L210DRAFT_852298 [Boletus edulis BED1]|uniref:Uncharacterized protein n=1 Tax=Boletus edulis BED1 TaxID=1328754 RepID=A0AAD4B9D6_BOLED|nr:hypothetical protein L210DRAFT_852298 [Boletus edulis BED1]